MGYFSSFTLISPKEDRRIILRESVYGNTEIVSQKNQSSLTSSKTVIPFSCFFTVLTELRQKE